MDLIAALQPYPALVTALAAVVGLLVGSFLNVVIHRLPKMLERNWAAECAELRGETVAAGPTFNLIVPRSNCPHCGHRIGALQNIPIASYLILGGRCANCRAPISKRYPLVEALSGALSGYIGWRFGLSVAALGALLFAWAMIAAAFIDLDTFYLPDNVTLPLLWAGLLLNLGGTFTDLPSAVIGAAAGYLVLWCVFWAFKFATGKEGMGYGDFKLLAAIGAWLGWKMLPLVILLSSLVGALVGIALIVLARHGRSTPIPFGPYLATAGVIAMYWGEPITRHYLQILYY
ncbi:MAG TPA: A24 family peptidase [Burkholderiales bacterium]|nr:A24 family peptidase [Burkholderiales bacterium]